MQKMYMNIHNSTIHNNQKIKMTQIFMNWSLDKQNIVYPHDKVLFNNKK